MRSLAVTAITVGSFAVAELAAAAILEGVVTPPTMAVGQSATVTFRLNAQDQPINTIAGLVHFPKAVQISTVAHGGSVVNFWVQPPTVDLGTVRFSGVIPGGYAGRDGQLFTVTFTARDPGAVVITAGDLQVLLNDGQGSAATITSALPRLTVSASLAAEPNVATTTPTATADTLPPEPFTPQVAKDPASFGDLWFVAFATQDQGTGVERYEIQEQLNGRIDPAAWKPVSSLFILSDQSLASTIFVRAVDRAGNVQMAVVLPKRAGPGYTNLTIWGILLIAILPVGMLIALMFVRVSHRREHGHFG